jgi:hypothetical protein
MIPSIATTPSHKHRAKANSEKDDRRRKKKKKKRREIFE